jgi:hypothetical protein
MGLIPAPIVIATWPNVTPGTNAIHAVFVWGLRSLANRLQLLGIAVNRNRYGCRRVWRNQLRNDRMDRAPALAEHKHEVYFSPGSTIWRYREVNDRRARAIGVDCVSPPLVNMKSGDGIRRPGRM